MHALIICDRKKEKDYRNILRMVKDIFAGEGIETETLCLEESHSDSEYSAWMQANKERFSYVCSLDMAGFRWGTLLGGALYNLLSAMQIHIVLNEAVLSLYKEAEYALNLFFFVPEGVEERIPFSCLNCSNYPALETEGGCYSYSERNKEALSVMIHAVMEENA